MPKSSTFEKSVFINCPFDKRYEPLFQALVFTIYFLGFKPRCSKEIEDGGVRIHKIIKLINECRYGIHDISRTGLDRKTRLPRFNMPLELGIDMGCRYLSKLEHHRQKSQLIMDSEPYRFQQFISDIAGQDVKAHKNRVNGVIRHVRDFLKKSGHPMVSADALVEAYAHFARDRRRIYRELRFKKQVSYSDYCDIVDKWLREQKKLLETGK